MGKPKHFTPTPLEQLQQSKQDKQMLFRKKKMEKEKKPKLVKSKTRVSGDIYFARRYAEAWKKGGLYFGDIADLQPGGFVEVNPADPLPTPKIEFDPKWSPGRIQRHRYDPQNNRTVVEFSDDRGKTWYEEGTLPDMDITEYNGTKPIDDRSPTDKWADEWINGLGNDQ